jgi:hypothetical protein
MVNELSESEILDFLMTSDFNEGLNLDELKFLLMKFRNFYRVTSCSITHYKERMENTLIEIERTKSDCDARIKKIETQLESVENKYDSLVNKNLTWKERLKGKIILDDEIK